MVKGRRGDEFPVPMAHQQGWLAQLKEAKAQLKQQAKDKATIQKEKTEAGRREEKAIGKRKVGATRRIWTRPQA
jgi:hypothetical protein